jgi:hypothetical protein
MKKKCIAAAIIFLLFFGFAWHLESNDQKINNLVHIQDNSTDIEQVDFESTEEAGVEYKQEMRVQKPFQSREYIRIIRSANIPQTN